MGGLVVAQGGHLAYSYRTPLTPVGPTSGLEEQHFSTQGVGRPRWRKLFSRAEQQTQVTAQTPSEGPLRVFVLGDSLVSGVGGEVGASPPLARGCVATVRVLPQLAPR